VVVGCGVPFAGLAEGPCYSWLACYWCSVLACFILAFVVEFCLL